MDRIFHIHLVKGTFALSLENKIFSHLFTETVASICNDLNIPHFIALWQSPETSGNPYRQFTRNLFPDSDKFARAIRDVVANYGWTGFVIIYDSLDSLARLHYVLQLNAKVNIYRLPKDSDDFKPIMKEISRSGETRIIIDCSIKNTIEVLRIADDVNLKEEYVVSRRNFDLRCNQTYNQFFI